MEHSDEALVARYRAGDVAAFEALLGRYQRGVHRFLARFLRDRERADDLAQECWLRFIGTAPHWDDRGRFKTWLFTVARNLATDEARRGVHRHHGTTDPTTRTAREVFAAMGAADDSLPDALLRSALERAIAALPAEQREVFLLREFEGVPFADIAVVTDAPLPTVKSRMRYALEALRRALRDTVPDSGIVPTTGSTQP